MPKSWDERYRSARPPHLVVLDKPFAGVPAGARMLIASPALLEARLRMIPPGATISAAALRAELAAAHGADACCPVTTSMFLRIVAERALEQAAAGVEPAPFWRAIDPASPLAGKLSCGADFIRDRRRAEAQ